MQLSREKDIELLLQLKNGSEAAFNRIYNLYSAALYINLLYLVKSEDTAKEILQDVFLKIWNKKEEIDPSRSFKSLLFRIGENLIYDYFRKVSRDQKLASEFSRRSENAYTHIEEVLFCKDTSEILHQAISELSPQRRQVFTLCKLEGKSYKEVSESLGISVSTISDHIVKATRSIKDYLGLNENVAVAMAIIFQTVNF